MAEQETRIIVTVKINPDVSWIDALKLRLSGGKYMMNFWNTFAERLKEKEAKKNVSNNPLKRKMLGRKVRHERQTQRHRP
jgi:hypothetical protein